MMANNNGAFEIQFENSLNITKWLLLISGIKISKQPYNKFLEHFIHHQLLYWNIFILHSVIFGEIYGVLDCIQTGQSFVKLSLNLPCITISFLSSLKIALLYINEDTLIEIYYKLKEIHCENDRELFKGIKKADDGHKIVSEAVVMLRVVVLLVCIICAIANIMFCIGPVLLMAYDYHRTKELVVIYSYVLKYPFFDVYQSSLWLLIYIYQVLATAAACINLFGCDTLLFALCSYLDIHFRLLGLQFENVVSPSMEETKKNLAKAVKRHQELIHLVNQTELLYSKSSLFHMVTSSFLICLSAFIMTITDEINVKLSYLTFLAMSLSQISLVCFFSDMLMRSSTEISGSVYKSPWYEADKDAKKIILLVIIRSQKACKLTAWRFLDLNLRAFTRILSTSWSYFALLKTMYN